MASYSKGFIFKRTIFIGCLLTLMLASLGCVTALAVPQYVATTPVCFELSPHGTLESADETVPVAALRVNPYTIGQQLCRAQRQLRQLRLQELYKLVFVFFLIVFFCQFRNVCCKNSSLIKFLFIYILIRSSFPYRAGPLSC